MSLHLELEAKGEEESEGKEGRKRPRPWSVGRNKKREVSWELGRIFHGGAVHSVRCMKGREAEDKQSTCCRMMESGQETEG